MELRGEGVRLLVEHADDEEARPGLLVQVSNEDEGQAAIVLEREDVAELYELLSDWLVDTEPEPDVPGRPL